MSAAPTATTTAPPLVAAIVLNWNGFDDTCAALDSLLAQTHAALRVHAIDNASQHVEADRLAARYGARIELHRNATNLGFAAGHNGLLQRLLADPAIRYVALLNNDATAAPDWIAQLVAAAERDATIGACASRMLLRDDPTRIDNAGVTMLRTGEAVPRGRGRQASAYAQPAELLAVSGGACLLRAQALREVGVFRPEFFLNFEDVDLSLRLVAAGYHCRYVPSAIVQHGLSRSIARVRDDELTVRSLHNLGFAYLVNMPFAVLLLGIPWLCVSWLLAPLACTLLGQRAYAGQLVRARLRLWQQRDQLLAARRALRPRRRALWWRIWWLHGSFVSTYARFLRDVVLRRRRAPMT